MQTRPAPRRLSMIYDIIGDQHTRTTFFQEVAAIRRPSQWPDQRPVENSRIAVFQNSPTFVRCFCRPAGILRDDFDGNLKGQCSSNAVVSGTWRAYGGLLNPHAKSSNSETGQRIRDIPEQLGVKE